MKYCASYCQIHYNQSFQHTHTHTHTHIYIYIQIPKKDKTSNYKKVQFL